MNIWERVKKEISFVDIVILIVMVLLFLQAMQYRSGYIDCMVNLTERDDLITQPHVTEVDNEEFDYISSENYYILYDDID